VIRVLERIAAYRGYPRQIRQDNSPEFIAHTLELWAKEHGVKLEFIKPGTPHKMPILNDLTAPIEMRY